MLDQACAHCPIFPTAASRRSLGRVSVPVWLIILSDQLPIVGLVSRYLTNYLIGRGPLSRRKLSPTIAGRAYPVLAFVSKRYSEPKGRFPRVTHPCATMPEGIVRLACVRHAASVRSEPGSNSQVQTASAKANAIGDGSSRPIQTQAYKPVTVCLLQLWMRTDVRDCADPKRTGTPRPTMKTSPPPAHPFSQHGMYLSNIPRRWKHRLCRLANRWSGPPLDLPFV